MAGASAFAVSASAARLKALATAIELDPSALEPWVKRRGARGVRALARAASEPRWADGAAAALAQGLGEGDERKRTGLCNEALLSLSGPLSWSELGPSASLRVCLFATVLGMVGEAMGGAESLGQRVLDVLALGGGASVAVLAAGREAKRLSAERRAAVDRWVATSLQAIGAVRPELEGRPRTGSRTRLTGADGA